MTDRQKEILYQNKRRLYLNSFSSRGGEERRLVNPTIAQEILARFHETDPNAGLTANLKGTEFRDVPPTKSGEEAYIEGITRALVRRDFYRKKLEIPDLSAEEQEVYTKTLDAMVELLNKTLKVWFTAAGIHEKDGSEVDREERIKAFQVLPKAIETYETEIGRIKRRQSLQLAEAVIRTAGEEPKPGEEKVAHPNLDQLLKECGEIPPDRKEQVDRICRRIDDLARQRIALHRKTNWVVKVLTEEINKPESEGKRVLLTLALDLYRKESRDREEAFRAKDRALLTAVRCLITGDPLDPVLAGMIGGFFGIELPALPFSTKLRELPGYYNVSEPDTSSEDREYQTMEEFREAVKELAEYRHHHRNQFEYQNVLSICDGLEDLPFLAARARSLRASVSRAVDSGMAASLNEKDQKELLEIWITAETMTKVAFSVLEYIRNNATKSLKELADHMLDDFAGMNFAVQRGINRETLTPIFQEKLVQKKTT